MDKTFSLLELGNIVRLALREALPDTYWVAAELLSLSANRHGYMELVEKPEGNNTPVAKARANCWAPLWPRLTEEFQSATGQQLRPGLKLRLQVRPDFHPAYGFSYTVLAIDPTFTAGDMAMRRRQIVEQLRRDGIFDLNRQLSLPLFCQKIAVVSAAGAAGYGDFKHHLDANLRHLRFQADLFPATMQGEQTESTIIAALNAIAQDGTYDCVVITRGGGAVSDLASFDTLALAENVAQFPIPVITGIGHDRDECILDMVSYRRVKTPTAAADFLIDHLATTLARITTAAERIAAATTKRMQTESLRLSRLAERLPAIFTILKTRHEAALDAKLARLATATTTSLNARRHRLEIIEERLRLQDPKLLLARGYSITTVRGKLIKSQSQVKAGDALTTTLYDGHIQSITQ